jgi:hypothetical protein
VIVKRFKFSRNAFIVSVKMRITISNRFYIQVSGEGMERKEREGPSFVIDTIPTIKT